MAKVERLITLALLLGACEGDGKMATAVDAPPATRCDSIPIGCGANATMAVSFADGSQLSGGSARVCRNQRCVDGPLPLVPMSGTEVGYGTTLSNIELRAEVTIWGNPPFRLIAATEEDSHLFVDGDIYTFVVRSTNGTMLVEGRWTATYVEQWGDSACGMLCKHAELQPAP